MQIILDCHVDDAHQLPWTDVDTCTSAEIPTPIPEIRSGALGLDLGLQPNAPEHQPSPTNSAVFCITRSASEPCLAKHFATPAQIVRGFPTSPPAVDRPGRRAFASTAVSGSPHILIAQNSYDYARTRCSTEQPVDDTSLSLDHSMPKSAGTVVAKQNSSGPAAPPPSPARADPDRETAAGSHTVKEDMKSHLLVGNPEVRKLCNGMDHTPWTSMLRLTKINCALLVTTCRLSV